MVVEEEIELREDFFVRWVALHVHVLNEWKRSERESLMMQEGEGTSVGAVCLVGERVCDLVHRGRRWFH